MEKIINRKVIASGRLLKLLGIEIDFGNGKYSEFERVEFNWGNKGVMIVALDASNNTYLVEQYQAGSERRMLCLPKGGLNKGESPIEMANIELQEEIGFKAKSLTEICILDVFPGYINFQTILFLAKDLIPKSSVGDEIEDVETIIMPFSKAIEACLNGQITDTRTIAGILMVDKYLNKAI